MGPWELPASWRPRWRASYLPAPAGGATCFHRFGEPLLAVEMDPLSDVYMLVALRSGAISLHDLTATPSRARPPGTPTPVTRAA